MHISLWCLPEITPDLVSAISVNMPSWQTCAGIQVKCLFELPFSVYQWIKPIPGFIQLWRYLLFHKKCYQTFPYEHDIKTFCSMVTNENEHGRSRWQTKRTKGLKHFLMVYLSLIIMPALNWETKAAGATLDTDPDKGLCPKLLTKKAQDEQKLLVLRDR